MNFIYEHNYRKFLISQYRRMQYEKAYKTRKRQLAKLDKNFDKNKNNKHFHNCDK